MDTAPNGEFVLAGFTRSDDLILVSEVQSVYQPIGDAYAARFSDIPPVLELSASAPNELLLGQSATLEVSLNTEYFSDLPLNLETDTTGVSLPPGGTIAAGATTVSFDLVAGAKGLVTVTASLPGEVGGATASTTIEVIEAPIGDPKGCSCSLGKKSRPSSSFLSIFPILALLAGYIRYRRRPSMGS